VPGCCDDDLSEGCSQAPVPALSKPEPQHELVNKIKNLGGGALEILVSNPLEAKELLNGLNSLFKKR
jgi:hypothetical protein